MPFIPNTDKDRREMLKKIGVKKFDDLLSTIPEYLRLKEPLNLPNPLSELEVRKLMTRISKDNLTTEDYISFLGAGCYDHYIPAAVDAIISRPEFYTAYTPYQPEASQGTLQATYEYQAMICELTKMDVANASLYDGGSALAEACHMAMDIKGGNRVALSEAIHPNYIQCVETYLGKDHILYIPLKDGRTDIEALKSMFTQPYNSISCVAIQHPNFFGCLEEVDEISSIVHSNNSLYIGMPLPISLGVLKSPGAWGADIVVAEGQTLGIPQSMGGPGLGIMAAHKEFIRKMPGRIIGRTQDIDGNQGFVMTLQTREQHIRRERATSNICTNQGLCAIAACVYLTLMGPQGLREVGELCYSKAHYLSSRITEIPDFSLVYETPFFNEFLIHTPINAEKLVDSLSQENIFAGVPISLPKADEPLAQRFNKSHSHELLIAVTELRTREELDYFVDKLTSVKGRKDA